MEQGSILGRAPRQTEVEWRRHFRLRQKLLDAYLLAVGSSFASALGSDRAGSAWWRRVSGPDAFASDTQAAEALADFCLHETLYEVGDIATLRSAYRVLEDEGLLEGVAHGRFLLDLAEYVSAQLHGHADPGRRLLENGGSLMHSLARRLLPGSRKALPRAAVSLVVADDQALENFVGLCLPSLSSGLEKLCASRDLTILVVAPPRHFVALKRGLNRRRFRCTIELEPLPPHLSHRSHTNATWDLLCSALQGVHLAKAAKLGADFLSVNPNAVYSADFLTKVLSIGEQAGLPVLGAALRPTAGEFVQTLRRRGRFRLWKIPATVLADLALDKASGPRVSASAQDYVAFRGTTTRMQLSLTEINCVRLYTTQYEIVSIPRCALKAMPREFFAKPGGEVDKMLPPGCEPRVIEMSDGLSIVDVGRSDSVIDQPDLREFGRLIGETARESQAALFKRPVSFPLASPPGGQLSGDPAELQVVLEAVEKAQSSRGLSGKRVLMALHMLHLYELSDYGPETLSSVIKEGRRLLDEVRDDDMTEDDVRGLVRASLNYDYAEKAVSFAARHGTSTAFIHEYLVEMARLKSHNAARALELRAKFPGSSFSVIGTVVWGQAYVDRFMDYCLASLLAAGNIPALGRNGRVVLSVVTTEEDRAKIAGHPLFNPLSDVAEVMFTCFPRDFLEQRESAGYNFYYFYGYLDHLNLFLASSLGSDLFLLPVDCVYSDGFLERLGGYLRAEADCCSIAGIESDEGLLGTWLKSRRSPDGRLAVAAPDLLQAAGQWPDEYFRSLIMSPSNTAFCRFPRELVWPQPTGLVVHSAFMHPLAVSSRMLAREFHPQHENVDYALLPRLIQGDGRLRIIQDASEACLAHLGAPLARSDYLAGGFSLEQFMEARSNDFALQRQCFRTAQFFPCRALSYEPSTSYPTDVRLLQAMLERNRFDVPLPRSDGVRPG